MHQEVGGTETWRKLATAFYTRVDHDPLLRPLFPGKTLHCATEELTAFLVQFFGGPSEDSQRRWWLSLAESHARFKIGPAERAAWLEQMTHALDDISAAPAVRSALLAFFEHSSDYLVNHGHGVTPAPNCIHEIERRWDAQRRIDDAVAALRAGAPARAISITEELRTTGLLSRSVLTGLLAQLLGNTHPSCLHYVQEQVGHDPALVRERYAGWTLLHVAAGRGQLTLVNFLLHHGADPNAFDGRRHTPLYSVANQNRGLSGPDIVHALVSAGALVNASDGVQNCTPLHMAARRGHVAITRALLDCNASIEARDRLGETPLRRAVNCNRIVVASLLIERGANLDSVDKKGITPRLAARTPAMRELLGTARDV